MTLEEIAFRIFLAHIQTGRDMVYALADDDTRARLQIGYAFQVAAKFVKVSESLGTRGV